MHAYTEQWRVYLHYPPSKKDQSPIVLGRDRAQAPTSRESDDDLKSLQFFHYAQPAHCMMKRMGYILNRGDGLIPLQPFVPEGKSPNYDDRTCRRLGYVTPRPQSEPEWLPSQFSDSSKFVTPSPEPEFFSNAYETLKTLTRATADYEFPQSNRFIQSVDTHKLCGNKKKS